MLGGRSYVKALEWSSLQSQQGAPRILRYEMNWGRTGNTRVQHSGNDSKPADISNQMANIFSVVCKSYFPNRVLRSRKKAQPQLSPIQETPHIPQVKRSIVFLVFLQYLE